MADPRFSPRITVYKITNGNKELLPIKIKQLTYTSTEKKADKCMLTVLNNDLRFPDDPTFDCGSVLAVSWGYPGNMATLREVIVSKWTPGYPDFKVEALGKGSLLNKIKTAETFENCKRSDVAKILAERWGYGPSLQFIDDTEDVYEFITKTMQTDASFLQKMAAREAKRGNGFYFAADQTGFYFRRERLGKAPIRTFRFIPSATDQGDLKDFPQFEAVGAPQNPGKVTATGVDLKTGKKVEGTASNDTDPNKSTLSKYVLNYAKDGTHTTEEKNTASETTQASGARTDEEAKKEATASYAKTTGKVSKGSLDIIGDPRIFAKDIIRLEIVSKRLSGNYVVYEAQHEIKAGDFQLKMKFRRDGLNGGSSKPGNQDPTAQKGNTNDSNGTNGTGKGDDGATKVVYGNDGTHKVIFTETNTEDAPLVSGGGPLTSGGDNTSS